jgi:ABC-2 type transport system permease protein
MNMKGISTMIWKETKELFSQGGILGYLTPLILLAVGGVVYPLISWSSWVQLGSLEIPFILFLTFQLIVASAADSFAGERERHTLETLLASRMPDRAILLGKVGTLVGYGWGMNFSLLLLGWLAVNIVHWQGHLVFYPFDLLLLTFALGLVVNILAASAGVLVSLRSATARQAQQMLTVGGLVAMFGITFGLLELTSRLLPSLGIVLDLAQLLALLLGLLAGIDIIVLTLVLVRFQRSRLMLIGK